MWTSLHGWTHVVADLTIFGAYAAIAGSIAYYVLKRRDVHVMALWWLFAGFIASCGLTHLVEATLFWHPWYRLSALAKVVTAVLSGTTAVVLIRLIPSLLSLPGVRDLNSRLRAEIREREKTEADRERFFDLSLDMICIANFEGYFVRVNPAFEVILGYSREEMQSRPFMELVHPDDVRRTRAEMANLKNGKATLEFENRYRTKEGTYRWLAWKAAPDLAAQFVYATARDVTEHRRVERALRLRERDSQLQLAVGTCLLKAQSLTESLQQSCEAMASHLDVARVCIWTFDPDDRMLDLQASAARSQAEAELPSRVDARESVIGHIAESRIPMEVPDLASDPALAEFHALAKSVPLSFSAYPLIARRQVSGAIAIFGLRPLSPEEHSMLQILAHDISAAISRHRTQDALRELNATLEERVERRATELAESQARFHNAMHHSAVGMALVSLEGRWLDVNSKLCRTLGYSAQELRSLDFQSLTHPDDLSADLKQVERLLAGEIDFYEMEKRYIHRNGALIWGHLSVSMARTAAGEPLYFISQVQDVTDRKKASLELMQSEERFRLMIEHVQDYAIFMLDPAGLVVSWNEGAERMTGFRAADIVGQSYAVLFPEKDGGGTVADALLAEAMKCGHVRDEGWRMRKDGRKIWAEVVLTAVIDAAGELRGYASITHDMTRRRESEAQSMRSQRLEAIGNIASGVAHDLNNALGPILMGLDLLRFKYPKEPNLIETFQSCGHRAADMVRQLLTFARGAEGERVTVRACRILSEMEKIMNGTLPKNIQTSWQCPADLQLIDGDPTQIHQILLNLCVNARDAMPDGGMLTVVASNVDVDEVFASAQDGAVPGPYVRIDVRDTGEGIPPHIIDRIFEPFFTTKSPDKGTGLGLSTVTGIVKGHGGFVRVYSAPGEGSTFSIFLPVCNTEEIEADSRPDPTDFTGHGETILVVDDEQTMREISRKVLHRLNFLPITATDGADALIRIAEVKDDLKAVLTDMHMPHMDGIGLIRAIRRVQPDLPVIVTSGRLEENEKRELQKLKIAGLLHKPFTQDELARALKEVLSQNGTPVKPEAVTNF